MAKNAKSGQNGSCGGHVTHFRYFGTPLISPERSKLQTSNMAGIGRQWVLTRKKCEIRSKVVMWITWPSFWILTPPTIRGMVEAKLQIWHWEWWQYVLTMPSPVHFLTCCVIQVKHRKLVLPWLLHSLRAVTNKIHQNRYFSKFPSTARVIPIPTPVSGCH